MKARYFVISGAVLGIALLGGVYFAGEQLEDSFETVDTQLNSAHGTYTTNSPSRQKREQRVVPSVAVKLPVDQMVPQEHRETYGEVVDNPVKRVSSEPVSTFSIDVDTGAYANVRRFLNNGQLPPENAVRIEEMVNYFDYAYPLPGDVEAPFSVTTHLMPTPWNPDTHLLRIGIKAYEVAPEHRPAANLVFLLDVSGSMGAPDKLPLLKSAFHLLNRQLTERDRVTMVVYAGAAGLVLDTVAGNETAKIDAALERLNAGGSTNGGEGIRLAYAKAREAFIDGGINRIILATDGDVNVGVHQFDDLLDMIKKQREDGISLTTLGFGGGNYNDHLLERLADAGNGNHAYIDTLLEANKVLGQQVTSTLMTVAKDVKTQIEFNPERVAEYRLVGYVNRVLREEDFTNDKVDAGELGAGHTVTVFYELALVGSKGAKLPERRYGTESGQTNSALSDGAKTDELAFVKLRYKKPDGAKSIEISQPITDAAILDRIASADDDLRFAAAVAAFGQILRGGRHTGDFSYAQVSDLARAGKGEDRHGYRHEFLRLVSLAENLDRRPAGRAQISQ